MLYNKHKSLNILHLNQKFKILERRIANYTYHVVIL